MEVVHLWQLLSGRDGPILISYLIGIVIIAVLSGRGTRTGAPIFIWCLAALIINGVLAARLGEPRARFWSAVVPATAAIVVAVSFRLLEMRRRKRAAMVKHE